MRAAVAAALLAGCAYDGPSLEGADLEYVGTSMIGDVAQAGPAITAVGGTSTVEVLDISNPLVFPGKAPTFDADDDGGAAVVIESQVENVVHVRAVAAGQNLLRVLNPDDGSLYDSVPMRAEAIDRVEALDTGGPHPLEAGEGLAYLTGPNTVGLALFGGDGLRLADESMLVEAAADIQQLAWDQLETNVAKPGVRTISLGAGSARHAVDIAFVSALDDIVSVPTINAGRTVLCFDGLNAGRRVVGITDWTVSGDAVTNVGGANHGCVELTLEAAGPTTLHVSAAGFEKDLEVTVVVPSGV